MERLDMLSNLRAHLHDGTVDLDPPRLVPARGDNLGHDVGHPVHRGHDLSPRAPVQPLVRRLLDAEVAADAHRAHETVAAAPTLRAARSANGSAGSWDVDFTES